MHHSPLDENYFREFWEMLVGVIIMLDILDIHGYTLYIEY